MRTLLEEEEAHRVLRPAPQSVQPRKQALGLSPRALGQKQYFAQVEQQHVLGNAVLGFANQGGLV